MRLPREVLKRDGVTLEPYFIQKAISKTWESPRSSVSVKVAIVLAWVVAMLLIAWIV